MKLLDCVEVLVEKDVYAKEGVHKGMQGWICDERCVDGYWLVNFPGYGEQADIAEICIRQSDLRLLYNGIDMKKTENS